MRSLGIFLCLLGVLGCKDRFGGADGECPEGETCSTQSGQGGTAGEPAVQAGSGADDDGADDDGADTARDDATDGAANDDDVSDGDADDSAGNDDAVSGAELSGSGSSGSAEDDGTTGVGSGGDANGEANAPGSAADDGGGDGADDDGANDDGANADDADDANTDDAVTDGADDPAADDAVTDDTDDANDDGADDPAADDANSDDLVDDVSSDDLADDSADDPDTDDVSSDDLADDPDTDDADDGSSDDGADDVSDDDGGGEDEPIGGCGNQLLRNGGFDQGDVAWLTSSTWPGVEAIVPLGDAGLLEQGIVPHTGTHLAWLGGIPTNQWDSHLVTIEQTVQIPSTASMLTFSGVVLIRTEEDEPGVAYDELYVDLIDAGEVVVWHPHVWTNLDASMGWVSFSFETTAEKFVGQTLTFMLHSETDPGMVTSFWFDSLRLVATCGR